MTDAEFLLSLADKMPIGSINSMRLREIADKQPSPQTPAETVIRTLLDELQRMADYLDHQAPRDCPCPKCADADTILEAKATLERQQARIAALEQWNINQSHTIAELERALDAEHSAGEKHDWDAAMRAERGK